MSGDRPTAADLGRAWLDRVADGDVDRRRWLRRRQSGAGHHVDALRLEAGTARLRVPGTRGRPPEVEVTVDELTGDGWERVIEAAGRDLRSTGDLLAGRLPDDLADPSLLIPDEIRARCSADAGDCRHIAEAHNVIAAAIERDPFRLLQLRGHRRQGLLAALRRERGVVASSEHEPIDLAAPWQARGPLQLQVHPRPPDEVTALLDRLGPPPGVDDPTSIEVAMQDAAAMAWRLAAGEGGDVADDEVVLAELRAQQVTSAERLADALGMEPAECRDQLNRLYEAGAVLRMGSGREAKYRAA